MNDPNSLTTFTGADRQQHIMLSRELDSHRQEATCPCKPHRQEPTGIRPVIRWIHQPLTNPAPPKRRSPNQDIYDVTVSVLDPDLLALTATDDEPIRWGYLMQLQQVRNTQRAADNIALVLDALKDKL